MIEFNHLYSNVLFHMDYVKINSCKLSVLRWKVTKCRLREILIKEASINAMLSHIETKLTEQQKKSVLWSCPYLAFLWFVHCGFFDINFNLETFTTILCILISVFLFGISLNLVLRWVSHSLHPNHTPDSYSNQNTVASQQR